MMRTTLSVNFSRASGFFALTVSADISPRQVCEFLNPSCHFLKAAFAVTLVLGLWEIPQMIRQIAMASEIFVSITAGVAAGAKIPFHS